MNYAEARPWIKNGDLIAVRSNHGGMPAVVRAVTRSPYTHTGVAVWAEGRLLIAETRGVNANFAPLSQYADTPFDVLTCPVDRAAVVVKAWGLLGTEIRYGWDDLVKIGLHELLGAPLPPRDDENLICSALSATIYLHAGWTPPRGFPSIPSPRDVVAALGSVPVLEVRGD